MTFLKKHSAMKAFIVKRYSKKEKLHLTKVAEPAVKENDVLV